MHKPSKVCIKMTKTNGRASCSIPSIYAPPPGMRTYNIAILQYLLARVEVNNPEIVYWRNATSSIHYDHTNLLEWFQQSLRNSREHRYQDWSDYVQRAGTLYVPAMSCCTMAWNKQLSLCVVSIIQYPKHYSASQESPLSLFGPPSLLEIRWKF